MAQYKITNIIGGTDLGVWPGASAALAVVAMLAEAVGGPDVDQDWDAGETRWTFADGTTVIDFAGDLYVVDAEGTDTGIRAVEVAS